MTKIVLFPGVFDPPTIGHLDIIKRAPLICEKLIVGVTQNLSKSTVFSIEERVAMLRTVTRAYPYVEIAVFSGLAIAYALERKALFILRGLRSPSDFDQESQMALANRQISGLDTFFFMSQHSYISSSLIREIAHFGGPLQDLVPEEIESFLKKKMNSNNSL